MKKDFVNYQGNMTIQIRRSQIQTFKFFKRFKGMGGKHLFLVFDLILYSFY